MGEELPVPERVLCDLLYRHWCMTVEGSPPHEKYVAYRPLNWQGEGDPFERITAPTRTELLRRLAHRHLGIARSTSTITGHTRTCVFTPEEGSPLMPRKPDPNRPLTPEEENAHRRQGELIRRRIEEEKQREQEQAAKEGR
ncbi:hypothetical protein [Nocardiopsis ganjiahuensis]|uniref:hypothetical protein n=1 Tax=Nocardiopsis ganjiahuensis TaxID=239984 RepID=UPI0003477843